MSSSPTITCPNCKTSFALDETLAGPMIAEVRQQAEARLREREAAWEQEREASRVREAELAHKERELTERAATLQSQVDLAVAEARAKIAAEERENARKALAPEREAEQRRLKELEAEAQTAKAEELKLRQQMAAVEQRARDIDLEVQRKLDAGREEIQEQAEKKAKEGADAQIKERDLKIERLMAQVDDISRRGRVGSQQLTGEAQEVVLERSLREAFVWDDIGEVPKGVRGADVLQTVNTAPGQPAGVIAWEVKQVANWGKDWAQKLKADQRECRADVAVLVSSVMPDGIETFGPHEGIWVCRLDYAIPLGTVLRASLIDQANTRRVAEGKATKAEVVYDYLTGQEFMHRMQGIAEPFTRMQKALDTERRASEKAFAARQKQIDLVLKSAFGLVGDLQGLAGADVKELEGIEIKALTDGDGEEEE